jgi:ketosteroid isomerase-like protein
MSESENKNVVLRFFKSPSTGDIDTALALMDNDAIYWLAGKPNQVSTRGQLHQTAARRNARHSGPCHAQRERKIHSGREYLGTIHAKKVLAQR